ncbi:hypothetical protein HN51_021440 [Arachis hypogaea]
MMRFLLVFPKPGVENSFKSATAKFEKMKIDYSLEKKGEADNVDDEEMAAAETNNNDEEWDAYAKFDLVGDCEIPLPPHSSILLYYEAPNATNPFQHSVYLFLNLWSFMNCDIKKAKRVAKVTQGGGEGFKSVLNKWQPYCFACDEKNGFHCNNGLMKFAIFPMIRSFWSSP